MKVLFVGGPASGQWIDVAPGEIVIEVPVYPLEQAVISNDSREPANKTFHVVLYRRVQINWVVRGHVDIFCPAEWSHESAISELLNGYMKRD